MDKNISYGIVCFDKEGAKILLVKRKYTYAFYNYVMNTYKINRKNLMLLFNQMSLEEKRKILQFEYEILWSTLWMEKDGMSMVLYHKNRRMYDKIVRDNKELILDCLCNCENLEDKYCNLWSIPKGRKNSISESELDVARREFEEETNISSKKYILHTDFKRECTLDNNYKLQYYIAQYKTYCPVKIKIQKKKENLQCMEIDAIEWMNLNDISNRCPYLKKHVRPAFNYFKKHHRLP